MINTDFLSSTFMGCLPSLAFASDSDLLCKNGSKGLHMKEKEKKNLCGTEKIIHIISGMDDMDVSFPMEFDEQSCRRAVAEEELIEVKCKRGSRTTM
ncbi:unnamed protein product [Camellia sinensis]